MNRSRRLELISFSLWLAVRLAFDEGFDECAMVFNRKNYTGFVDIGDGVMKKIAEKMLFQNFNIVTPTLIEICTSN